MQDIKIIDGIISYRIIDIGEGYEISREYNNHLLDGVSIEKKYYIRKNEYCVNPSVIKTMHYKRGLKSGIWTYENKLTGRMVLFEYKNGIKNGKYIHQYLLDRRTGYYKDGLKDGTFIREYDRTVTTKKYKCRNYKN